MTESEPLSYRTDPAVPTFDDSAPLLVFDGTCVFCSTAVAWRLKLDPDGATRFAAVQSPVGRALYIHYGLDPDAFDTFMVLKNGVPYLRYRGWLEAMKPMPAPWKWLSILGHVIPTPIGDACYDFVQRNRIKWFGARKDCFVPAPSARARMLGSEAELTAPAARHGKVA
jgi:predicted DCC family thiol-disulfide oxidoreductase YuxK